MTYTTLISAEALKNFRGELRIFDCSADLSQPHAGREQFEAQHIAGAGFADINTDLSSHDPALAVNGGRSGSTGRRSTRRRTRSARPTC